MSEKLKGELRSEDCKGPKPNRRKQSKQDLKWLETFENLKRRHRTETVKTRGKTRWHCGHRASRARLPRAEATDSSAGSHSTSVVHAGCRVDTVILLLLFIMMI